ncbi:MAG: helix-turn-helix domain-containing protein [Cyclobacteriaceae bacterium]|nr:ATP-binding protein [Flammeovirgaceae bacterium]
MKNWEDIRFNEEHLYELRKLAIQGEGIQLEFKRKATHPEKVVREMIAFANTHGGTVLIGVDDDGSLVGVKYPEDEMIEVQRALQNCKPTLIYNESLFALRENRFVIRLDIPESDRRPHFYAIDKETSETYVRVKDMSIKASAEMQEIIRRTRKKKDIQFTYGDHENQLMKYLEEHKTITLPQFRELTGLNRFKASRKLILLVLADVLKITASEKGDLYSRGAS